MVDEDCLSCICRRCRLRVSNNCCEMCQLNGYSSPNDFCDNDDVLIKLHGNSEED